MKMEQIMECMLAEMKTNREMLAEIKASKEQMKEEMKTG
jgi:hypothetical protein